MIFALFIFLLLVVFLPGYLLFSLLYLPLAFILALTKPYR